MIHRGSILKSYIICHSNTSEQSGYRHGRQERYKSGQRSELSLNLQVFGLSKSFKGKKSP